MKIRNFTQWMLIAVVIMTSAGMTLHAQDLSTGTGWSKLNPTEPLVLNEKFQGFKFFHSDSTTNMGNSNNTIDEVTGETISGYTNLDTTFNFIGKSAKVHYKFDTCAFAPEWTTAGAFASQSESTQGVSNGFVEISRRASGTQRGHFTVDLRAIDFVEVIQYSHSSCGGNKRGVLVEYSIDNGETWDSLRYQPGNSYSQSFTSDIITRERTPNTFRCDPSAYGMLWEDAIYSENLMIRFLESGGQVVRIHDLKVYGTIVDTKTSKIKSDLAIRNINNVVTFSKVVDVKVYTASGALVKSSNNTRELNLSELNNGVFIIRAAFGNQVVSKKIVKRN